MKNLQLFVRKGQFSAGQGRKNKETNGQSAEIQLNRPPLHTVSNPGKNKYGSLRKILNFFDDITHVVKKDYSIFHALPYLFSPGLETVWSGGLFS